MALQTFTTTYEPAEFKTLIAECVKESIQSQIAQLITPSEPLKEILTRQETARLLGISLPTLAEYTKRNLIIGYRFGYKIRYKRLDVHNALIQINSGISLSSKREQPVFSNKK